VLWLKLCDEDLNRMNEKNGVEAKEWSTEGSGVTDEETST
jgi:hypothetical protein